MDETRPFPQIPPDNSRDEIRRYRAYFKDCSAEDILRVMGEMHEFFFGRMTPQDFARYSRVKARLSENE